MGFKELIEKLGEKQRNRKEMIRQLDDNVRIHKLVEDRQKSSNERELERFQNEDREENIKHALETMRKKRDHDIKFNHNALDVENITNHTDWEVLKERNMFGGRQNMFANQNNIHKSNHKLLNSGNILKNEMVFSI